MFVVICNSGHRKLLQHPGRPLLLSGSQPRLSSLSHPDPAHAGLACLWAAAPSPLLLLTFFPGLPLLVTYHASASHLASNWNFLKGRKPDLGVFVCPMAPSVAWAQPEHTWPNHVCRSRGLPSPASLHSRQAAQFSLSAEPLSKQLLTACPLSMQSCLFSGLSKV